VVQTEEWTGRDVTVAEIERELTSLRETTYDATTGPDLRTNVLTHLAWVPAEWRGAADQVLAQLAERHPSRTIVLTPRPDEGDGLDAELAVQCFPLPGEQRNVCSELIDLRLRGRRVHAPASIVEPLLIPDLPVFIRWRGQPPFGQPEFEQLIGVADRLVVDSREWPDLPDVYARLARIFDRISVSDITWARTLEWRGELAKMWPGIGSVETLRVAGPDADALLLTGWLRSRLGRSVGLEHDEADDLQAVEVDGETVPEPHVEARSPADLLSDQLEIFSRDPIYEAAVGAASER
jgi:Glucose-6-phosphate dehydrogenase subunit N-terminal domain/Glucose-6-phosphate dehydrogenase subunit C-terminal domain